MIAATVPCCPACGALIPESGWQTAQWECPNSRCGLILDPVEVVA